MPDVRRRLTRVVNLAADRVALDCLCVEIYALLEREQAMGLRDDNSPGVRGLIRYTCLDDRWAERRERLPAELAPAFDAAIALVRLTGSSVPLVHEIGGHA